MWEKFDKVMSISAKGTASWIQTSVFFLFLHYFLYCDFLLLSRIIKQNVGKHLWSRNIMLSSKRYSHMNTACFIIVLWIPRSAACDDYCNYESVELCCSYNIYDNGSTSIQWRLTLFISFRYQNNLFMHENRSIFCIFMAWM